MTRGAARVTNQQLKQTIECAHAAIVDASTTVNHVRHIVIVVLFPTLLTVIIRILLLGVICMGFSRYFIILCDFNYISFVRFMIKHEFKSELLHCYCDGV